MILADSSIWIDHFRQGNKPLAVRLRKGEIACHVVVIGELACGSMRNRASTLSLIQNLHRIPSVPDAKVLELIERRRLHGRGLGWTDAQLVASALTASVPLWTLDSRLHRVAQSLGIAY